MVRRYIIGKTEQRQETLTMDGAKRGSSDRHVRIFDTTLRDGQQCPGAGMSFDKNLEYAHLAAQLRVDVLEAGFPSASQLDFEIVSRIASELATGEEGPVIAGLCQLRSDQIDRTIEALHSAIPRKRARVHTYVPVDPGLMVASLGKRAEDFSGIVNDVGRFIERATAAGCEVEFSPEGYSRMGANFDFVTDLIRAAVQSGASVINCPDTIGGASRMQGDRYFVHQMKQHAAIIAREFPDREVTWSVHCHNDFGLALDNSLEGVFRGPALQVEGCMNGIGERAGNVALEQVILAIEHFGSLADQEHPFWTRIDVSHLQRVSDFVRRFMLPRQPHWPITGDNASKHSSGGHTNAILRNPLAYQPFDPRSIGREVSIVFGPLSGGNHAKALIEVRGYRCDDHEKAAIAQHIKSLFKDRRKGITEEELFEGYLDYRRVARIESFQYRKEGGQAGVTLRGTFFGREGEFSWTRQGEDSALVALKDLIDQELPGTEILSHRAESEEEGARSRSVSRIVIRNGGDQTWTGVGVDSDIEIAAMKALLDAVNRAWIDKHFAQEPRPFSLSGIAEEEGER
jgi:2-isopropylmalate synthase